MPRAARRRGGGTTRTVTLWCRRGPAKLRGGTRGSRSLRQPRGDGGNTEVAESPHPAPLAAPPPPANGREGGSLRLRCAAITLPPYAIALPARGRCRGEHGGF